MISQEKRKCERPDIFLIIKFRRREKSYRYSFGVTSNVSHRGVKFEASDSSFGPGEVLEILLKHPHDELSVAASGQIVWKRSGWYEYEMGLQLHEMDQEASGKLEDLMTSAKEDPVGPHVISGDNGDEDDANKVQMLARKLSVRRISAIPPVMEVKNETPLFRQGHDHALSAHAKAQREKKSLLNRERFDLMRMFLIQQKNRGWSAIRAWADIMKKTGNGRP